MKQSYQCESNLLVCLKLAFIAGLLTSLTPCSLTSLPIVMSYISGTKSSEKRKALTISLLFALGMALVYTTLGVFASLLGELLHHLGVWWYLLLAAVTVLMALHMFGIIDIIPDSLAHPKSVRKGYAGAAAGMLGGFLLLTAPCPCWWCFWPWWRKKAILLQGAHVAALCLGAQCL